MRNKDKDFPEYISAWFKNYIPLQVGCCQNIYKSYRDAFCSFISYMDICKNIKPVKLNLSVILKKVSEKVVNYMTIEELKLLLGMVDTSNKKGRRDLAVISLLYDSGVRAQKLLDITTTNVELTKPSTV